MNKSKVYFTDLRAPVGTSQLTKLQRLIRSAGIGEIDMEKKLVAIKLHFGEPGNLTYLRPNYATAGIWVIRIKQKMMTLPKRKLKQVTTAPPYSAHFRLPITP